MSRSSSTAESPPGPQTIPFIGNALSFFRWPFAYRTEVARKHGDIVDVSGLGQTIYLVSDPDAIERVLVTDADAYEKPGFEKRFLRRSFGNSLPLAEGDEWMRGRKVCQPVFERERIRQYGETMAQFAAELVEPWTAGETVNVDRAMKQYTFEVFMATMFSLDRERVPDLHADFEAIAKKIRPRHAVVPDWIPTPTNRRYERALDRLETEIDSLLRARKRTPTDEREDDLLSLLIAANDRRDDPLSDERLRDEMLSFLFAGHETTAMAFTFTWFLLATHPDARKRLDEELDETLDRSLPTAESVTGLPFLEAVISESLRLYPPNHMIPREPTRDVTLGGYRLPAGASVYCSQWVVHRDERWWKRPDEFVPNRWLRDRERPEYAYFPFGGGPRHCIGLRFAKLELQIGLAAMAQQVALRPVEPGQELPALAAGLSTHLKDPLYLTVEATR